MSSRIAGIALTLAMSAATQAALAQEVYSPIAPAPGIPPAHGYHGTIGRGEIVESPPMDELEYPAMDAGPGASGGGTMGYPGVAEPMYPAVDHCQLLQVHFPDWQSNPRMNAYLTTYCFG